MTRLTMEVNVCISMGFDICERLEFVLPCEQEEDSVPHVF